MPNNKKKGRSAKKGAKDDRKAEKKRKKFEARLIHEPCPNGLRCSDPKCRHVHVCPHTLELTIRKCFLGENRDWLPKRLGFSRSKIEREFPSDSYVMDVPIQEMSANAQELLDMARHEAIQRMIQIGGYDFRFSVCSGHECGVSLQLNGIAKGNTDLRKEIDSLYCSECDCTFCEDCIHVCKECKKRLCFECDPLLHYVFNPAKLSETIAAEIFCAGDGHCSICTTAVTAKTIHALDETKYRAIMLELYSKIPSCAYCTASLPNGPDTKRCGGCAAVRYCGKECQEKDWSGKHRHYCQVLRQDRNDRLAKWYQKHQPKLEAEAGLWDIE